jgi:glutamine synthetase
MGFIERHEIWTREQQAAADDLQERAAEQGLEVIRLAFADQHGLLHGKTIMVSELAAVLREGSGVASSLLAKDTSGRTVVPMFNATAPLGQARMRGAADMVMVPDPGTFRVLPWASATGWILCDLWFGDGSAVPLCSRGVLRAALGRLAAAGRGYVTGLEVEFHLFRRTDPSLAPADLGQPGNPPEVEMLNHGYQYLSELRFDELEPIFTVLQRHLTAIGLPVRTMEVEFGPSQVELTLGPTEGLATADNMVLLRSAVKQVAARHGYHATFMSRPNLPEVFSSGWHLHQSVVAGRANVFAPPGDTPAPDAEILSADGRRFLAGLLAHARGASAFAVPTINGYKRFQPYSLAPDRAVWGRDNRGAMVRVVGSREDGSTRLENRVGEPAANPYLYLASQLLAGLDGIERELDPGPSADQPYENTAVPLPRSLREALDALEEDKQLRAGMGEVFVDYYLAIKRAEVARFEQSVTDWEHREYFRMF